VFERYYRELLNFLSRSVHDRDTAADLAQESYARVLAAQQTGQAVQHPRALLYRTARNLVIDQHRRSSIRAELETAPHRQAMNPHWSTCRARAAWSPRPSSPPGKAWRRWLRPSTNCLRAAAKPLCSTSSTA